ncbi:hypothetical protein C815_01981 [Firmicutes bacterium M10-2]|nr:hypothetical protein C815_01981 [Firmicutes bacterium M10-2]
MNFKQLHYFVDLAENELNITKTASRFYISQSAVTKQIQALEQELGVELFVRESKRLHLTHAGTSFYPYAKKIIEDEEIALSYIHSLKNGTSGILRIGMILHLDLKLILPFLQQFNKIYPDIDLSIYSNSQKELLKDLELGKSDVMIAIDHFHSRDFMKVSIATYPLVALVSVNDKLAKQETVSLSDLDRVLFDTQVVDENRSSIVIDECLAKIACNQGQAVYHSFVYHDSMNPWIKCIPIDPPILSNLYIFARKDRLSLQAKLFLQFAKRYFSLTGVSNDEQCVKMK